MTETSTPVIEISHLRKDFGAHNVLSDISLSVFKGEVVSVIGSSGSGKSTMLRCINLLETPTAGDIRYNGKSIMSSETDIRRYRAEVGMVFQQFNLFNNMTALGNCVIGQRKVLGRGREEAESIAMKYLEKVGMGQYINAKPRQLSGGQKQRVAIARALATDPEVLLCDEATSALDPNTTRSILALLKEINDKLGVTVIIITHEMKVVEQICDKVAVLNNGEVVESGYVKDVFLSPKSEIARELILPKGGATENFTGGRVIRLVFDGQESCEPVVANICLECRAAVNIMGADTKDIGGKAFGQMLLQLPEDENSALRIINYLNSKNYRYEEASK